jgi:hypothetical protein
MEIKELRVFSRGEKVFGEEMCGFELEMRFWCLFWGEMWGVSGEFRVVLPGYGGDPLRWVGYLRGLSDEGASDLITGLFM